MKPRVLVVEDSQVIQRLIGMCLAPTNIDVEFCSDGEEGYLRALADPPQGVVLDIGLPTMTGWEVLEALRSAESTSKVPVLVLTAHAREDVRRKAAEVGATAAIAKPFNPTDFRRIVLDMLARSQGGAVA